MSHKRRSTRDTRSNAAEESNEEENELEQDPKRRRSTFDLNQTCSKRQSSNIAKVLQKINVNLMHKMRSQQIA